MKKVDMSLEEVMILAGGRGTRLSTIVNDRPKPMAVVAGRPFLEWLLRILKKQGLEKIILCTGYMGDSVEKYFKDGHSLNLNIEYSSEPEPLGTAGAVRNALDLVENSNVIILNGDSYCRFDSVSLVFNHSVKKALISMWVVNVDDSSRYGSVKIRQDGLVQAFEEKTAIKKQGLINAGIYYINVDIIREIPQGKFCSLEKDLFPQFVNQGLFAIVGEPPFLDIGTPESYYQATELIRSENL